MTRWLNKCTNTSANRGTNTVYVPAYHFIVAQHESPAQKTYKQPLV